MSITPVAADDPLAASADPVQSNIECLKALLPDAFGDGKIDFEVLRQLLGDAVDDGDERYGLNWSGKRAARRAALTPSLGTLRPAPEDSVEWDKTRNIVIEGDNLEVLKLLQKSYAGKVKLIYIDPPYNTGNDFVYPDDYTDSIGNYLRRTGQIDSEGVKNSSNAESSGRFHTDWLNMMYPRLMLARSILRSDGFIFVSIDHNEVASLRSMMDAIFGAENFRNSIIVRRGVKNVQAQFEDIGSLSAGHEYILCYSKSSEVRLPPLKGQLAEVQAGKWDTFWRGTDRPTLRYELFGQTPKTGQWRWSKPRTTQAIANYQEFLGHGGNLTLDDYYLEHHQSTNQELDFVRLNDQNVVQYYVPPQGFKLISSNWMDLSISGSETETFNTEKHVDLLTRICGWLLKDEEIVLDFFAGSGTTGHAVMAQNAADGGSRRYILVQLPEPLDPANKDQKVAADFCDKIGKPRTIAELTKERLRTAAAKVKAENPDAKFDGGFRVYKLASSNLKVWQPGVELEKDLLDAADNLVPGRTDDDLLVELLLKRGIDLVEPEQTRTIVGRTVHALGGGVLVVCLADVSAKEAEALADGIAEWVIELDPVAPAVVIFKDSGFEDDNAKVNVDAILRQRLHDRGADQPHLLDQVRSV